MTKNAPSLVEVVDILHEIAPLELAAEWDNTGLLIAPRSVRRITRVMLTIDLTDAVVAEAVAQKAQLVVAYHPPIWKALRKLSHENGRQRVLLDAVVAGLAVYSPHTALDAAPGGIADWLAEGVLAGGEPEDLRPCGEGDYGRVVKLPTAVPFAEIVKRAKRHLGVDRLQIARPALAPAKVRTIAVAAGAGGSLLRGVAADVMLTGEMSHHDALEATADGAVVLLAGHTNTERGYLPVLKKRLGLAFGKDIEIRIAKRDRDPFAVV